MGAGDLTDRGAFREAGARLAALGLVRGSEGNLSTWHGRRLAITRTGSELGALGPGDVLEGTLEAPPEGASSDLALHVELYRRHGPGAVAHAHPPGSVPDGWKEGEPHGRHAHATTLPAAVEALVGEPEVHPVSWEGDAVRILDQRVLPHREVRLACRSAPEVAEAISTLAVRGAPAIGVAAAFGMALAAATSTARSTNALFRELHRAGELLKGTRPTAVNLGWAVDRMLGVAREHCCSLGSVLPRVHEAMVAEALAIEAEDRAACAAMGAHGAELVPVDANVLTHCNTGMLCTAGIGTALGVVITAHRLGKRPHVWVDETRPVWQGARLTAWELRRLEIPMTLIADGAAASLMAEGRVDLVVVGADRVAANGDVANKVGTYGLAVLARHHGVPFYVVAPVSSVDVSSPTGADIRIEERDPAEVTSPLGIAVAEPGTPAANPAFDVTPAELVSALVTERGVLPRLSAVTIGEHLTGRRSA